MPVKKYDPVEQVAYMKKMGDIKFKQKYGIKKNHLFLGFGITVFLLIIYYFKKRKKNK